MVGVDPPITLSILRLVKYPQRPNTVRPNSADLLLTQLYQFPLALPLCALARFAVSLRLLPYTLTLPTYRTYCLVPYEGAVLESAVVILPNAAYRSAMG